MGNREIPGPLALSCMPPGSRGRWPGFTARSADDQFCMPGT